MRSTSTFRPIALLATRGTTASFQLCSDTGRARAGGRVRTFRCAARVRAALRSSAGKVSVSTVVAASCRTQCLKGRASARDRGEQHAFDGGEAHAHGARLAWWAIEPGRLLRLATNTLHYRNCKVF